MSVTGDYVFAQQALDWGLVNEVLEPDDLVPRALEIARTAAKIAAAPQLLATYTATTGGTVRDGWVTEQIYKRGYAESDGQEVGRRYGAIRERGASQQQACWDTSALRGTRACRGGTSCSTCLRGP